jgi:hypothetical protein
MSVEVQALLTRLIGQFAEPYDFLRELVQNALDAGSDRAEVVLETHEEGGEEVVFELRVSDAGCGMDEAVIDNGLTRLFASTKADDRTMAGGYGIGFVSVFAWEPEVVVVHTGKGGEAWELVFYPDRRFEKVALTEPVEGTTVTLLRRGQAHERAAIAEAVRDSLWRWCRFCKLEVSFEDVAGGAGPELIEDSPPTSSSPLAISEEQAETSVHVAFAVPAGAVLLRRGLILAEGTPGDLLGMVMPELRADAGRTGEHVQVWVDSPLLRTTMARDKVVEDAGQREVLARVVAAVKTLRERLVAETEQAAGEAGAWSRARHERFVYLHAHLSRERKALGAGLRGRLVLRDLAGARALAPAGLATLLRGRPVVVAGVEEAGGALAAVLAAARTAGFPVLAADGGDRGWLAELLEGTGPVVACEQALFVEQAAEEGEALRAAVERGLAAAGVTVAVRLAGGGEGRGGLVGVELTQRGVKVEGAAAEGEAKQVEREAALVVYSAAPWPEQAWKGGTVWISDDMVSRAALKAFTAAPWTAATTLTAAVLAGLGQAPDAAAKASEGLKDLAARTVEDGQV